MINPNELLDFSEYLKLLAGLFAIVDIPGSLPIFLNATSKHSIKERNTIALLASIIFFFTLIIFAFFGDSILRFFGITIEAFQIAGGLLLLLMALDMMRSEQSSEFIDEVHPSNVLGLAIFPIAIPLLAGPGALSTIVIYTHRHESLSHDILISVVVASVSLMIFLGFRIATFVSNILGPTGLAVMNRVMGLIVASIGVEFIIDGLATHFPAWVK
ncbi:MAG: NAAT family transporter [Gammaproteobacteria bacterium]|nr:NAAT family transporter [Gammaproteobacteria bacterium]